MIEEHLPADERGLTQLICAEADRIRALIDRMESFGDTRSFSRAPVNIHEVLDRVRRAIVRNAQEKRQLALIEEYLTNQGYRKAEHASGASITQMEPGTFGFRMNVLVTPSKTETKTVKIPIDAVVQPKSAVLPNLPISGVLAAFRAGRLAKIADISAALTIEAILGTDRAFDPRVVGLRPHPGQMASARNLMRLLEGSEILSSHRTSDHIVQDAYSIRCAPQVHGAFRDVVRHSVETLEIELASVSDNPVVLAEAGEILSGGNFHGQPVALACDSLAAASVGLASISERRLFRLLDPKTSNGLPAFLVGEAGVNSGFMVCQYTAASLVSEMKSLAHPAAVDSIPSSAGQEDHVSMGMISARHARECIHDAEAAIAMEVLAAAQACDLRAPLHAAPASRAAVASLRRVVPTLTQDRALKPDVDATIALVRSGELIEAVEATTGPLE